MPFGKYKGRPISKIPKTYLEWLAKNTKLKLPALKQEILECLANNLLEEDEKTSEYGLAKPR